MFKLYVVFIHMRNDENSFKKDNSVSLSLCEKLDIPRGLRCGRSCQNLPGVIIGLLDIHLNPKKRKQRRREAREYRCSPSCPCRRVRTGCRRFGRRSLSMYDFLFSPCTYVCINNKDFTFKNAIVSGPRGI